MCFSCFISKSKTTKLSVESLFYIFNFCADEIEHLQGVMSMLLVLLDTISCFLRYIFEQPEDQELDPIRKESLLTLFYIATTFQSNHSQVVIYAALKSILAITRVFKLEENNALTNPMISASCVLVSQQLVLCNSRDSFIVSLQIFFNIFRYKYLDLLSCFEPCFM